MESEDVLLYLCDDHLAQILHRRIKKAALSSVVVSSMEELERKVSKYHPHIVVVDAACEVSTTALYEHLSSLPTLQSAELILYAEELSVDQIEDTLTGGFKHVFLKKTTRPQALVKYLKTVLDA